jgi:hypothetical protein
MPIEGYPPVSGGFLDAETVWSMLLSRGIGLTADRPDLLAILKWSSDVENVRRYREAPTDFRRRAQLILLAAAGASNSQLAQQLQLDRGQVRLWRSRWVAVAPQLATVEAQGSSDRELMALINQIFSDRNCPGTSNYFSTEQVVQIVFVTLWAFLSQVLDADKSCHNAVSRVIAWLSSENVEISSQDTGAYCQARQRLPEKLLQKLFSKVAQELQAKVTPDYLWGIAVTIISARNSPPSRELYSTTISYLGKQTSQKLSNFTGDDCTQIGSRPSGTE